MFAFWRKEREEKTDENAKAIKKLCTVIEDLQETIGELKEALAGQMDDIEYKITLLEKANKDALDREHEIKELKDTVHFQTNWMHQLVFKMLESGISLKGEEKAPSPEMRNYLNRKNGASSKPLPLPG